MTDRNVNLIAMDLEVLVRKNFPMKVTELSALPWEILNGWHYSLIRYSAVGNQIGVAKKSDLLRDFPAFAG